MSEDSSQGLVLPIFEHCSTCERVDYSWASNERGFCCGIVKNPKHRKHLNDIIRFCLIDMNGAESLELSLEEAFDIASILTTVACHFIEKRGLNVWGESDE